jgi:hypothetical protein
MLSLFNSLSLSCQKRLDPFPINGLFASMKQREHEVARGCRLFNFSRGVGAQSFSLSDIKNDRAGQT